MRRARAHDKQTGEFVRMMNASAMTEDLRYAYDYRCCEAACNCTVHWRKFVHAKENTDPRAATFAKNASSEHVSGCHQDYERIARDNSAYTYFKDGAFHVRINFPMGASDQDIYPGRGYLSQQQIHAANNTKDITPFSTAKSLVAFIEKNLGELDSEDLPDLVLHYQGRTALLADKVVGNMDYQKLYDLSIAQDRNKNTPVALTIVKPTHEIKANDNGKRRFVCAPQEARINGRKHAIKPVIVCYYDENAQGIADAIQKNQTLVVMTRPYSTGQKFGYKETTVSLSIRKNEQVTPVSSRYWRVPQLQFDFPPGPSPVLHP